MLKPDEKAVGILVPTAVDEAASKVVDSTWSRSKRWVSTTHLVRFLSDADRVTLLALLLFSLHPLIKTLVHHEGMSAMVAFFSTGFQARAAEERRVERTCNTITLEGAHSEDAASGMHRHSRSRLDGPCMRVLWKCRFNRRGVGERSE
jgi:hypothetical protein